MKVVLDTNVLVSSVLFPLRIPAQILGLILSQKVTLLVSNPILEEYRDVLCRNEFSFPKETVYNLLRTIELTAERVSTYGKRFGLPDPDDEVFLECALEGGADFLITGNKKHFPMQSSRPVKIVSPSEFLSSMK